MNLKPLQQEMEKEINERFPSLKEINYFDSVAGGKISPHNSRIDYNF
jgi:hypothetical protein